MKNLCIIPARGGSKRLPGKNIKPLNGKPLLAYSIEAARAAGLYDTILVSSDEDEILEIAVEFGAEAHARREDLSGDNVTAFKVFLDILTRDDYGAQFGTITGMLPTCPFKTGDQIQEAMELLLSKGEDASLISVVKFDYPPQLGFTMTENHGLTMTNPEVFGQTTRSQNIETVFHNNGAFWMTSVANYLKHGTFYGGTLIGYEMDELSSYDIDYPWQFEIAEILGRKIDNHELTR